VIINGDYEGDVDCGGRFEIGSTGRVKGKVKAQVLVVKEGAHFEGGVIMTPEGRASSNAPQPAATPAPAKAAAAASASSGSGSIFNSKEREAPPAAERTPTGPGTGNS
jgi:cytoskeletal protein CcmA (bactofilin family)